MAPTSTALASASSSKISSALDHEQTLKASRALLVHIKEQAKKEKAGATKRDLLAPDSESEDASGEVAPGGDTPVWLLISTKKHVLDQPRLKPGKVHIPHSFNDSPDLRVCLITADPQRPFKETIDHPAFPEELRSRISRVIGEDKIRRKYKSYESRRQLFSEHDVFLADDRVIAHLPHLLGKVFYKSGAKRPIPIVVSGKKEKRDEKAPRKTKGKEEVKSIAPPKAVADEITRTLSTALVHLTPSTSTAVKVAKAAWDADAVADNVEAALNAVVEKFIPQKWRGLRAAHIKGPNTAALPVWLAEELWTDENDVLEDAPVVEPEDVKAIEDKPEKAKKRKASDAEEEGTSTKKSRKARADGDALANEKALRKEMLKKQKSAALEDVQKDAAPAKKEKKTRAVAAA